MSSSSAVRTAWNSYIWQDDAIQAVTPNVFLYDVGSEAELDVDRLYHDTLIDFFTCRVQRSTEHLPVGQTRYTFEVRVEYYRQQTDVAESTFNSVTDRLEVADGLVRTSLGKTWAGTVDFFQGGKPVPVASVVIHDRACWRGGFVYTATKTI